MGRGCSKQELVDGSARQDDDVTSIHVTLPGYPAPAPAKRDLVFDDDYFTDVDRQAAKVPRNAMTSFCEFFRHLTGPYLENAKKIRAILVWYTRQDVNKMTFPKVIERETPLWYMARLRDNKVTFKVLFVHLCRKAGIPCVLIEGLAKGVSYEVGDQDIEPSMWAAVYIENDWRLIEPKWAVEAVLGFQKGGKVMIENSGTITAQREVAHTGSDVISLREYYVFTPADQFIFDCLPHEDEWQLLKKAVTRDQFLDMPFIVSPEYFFWNQFSFKSNAHSVQRSEGGMCTVAIRPVNIKMATMSSRLFYHEKKSKMTWERASSLVKHAHLDQFVFKNRNLEKGEMEFEVRFPAQGVYELHLYGGFYDIIGHGRVNAKDEHLSVFRLDCDSTQVNCKPYPSNPPIGYGPGPEMLGAGLKPKTHRQGRLYLSANDSALIRFKKTAKYVIKNKIYKTELKSRDGEHGGWVSQTTSKQNYDIKLNPKKSGEYMLEVKAKDKGEDDSQFENVCNYLVQVEGAKRNTHVDKIVTDDLTEALTKNDLNKLELALVKFEKREIRDAEGLIVKAKRKVRLLKFKEAIQNALCKKRVDEIEKAIDDANHSEFSVELKRAVDRARYELARLERHKGGRNDLAPASRGRRQSVGGNSKLRRKSESLHAGTLLEIKKYICPPDAVRDVMRAFLIILGTQPSEVKEWEKIVHLLAQSGKKNILQRLRLMNVGDISEDSQRTAEHILSKYSSDHVRDISVSVAIIRDWTHQLACFAKAARLLPKKRAEKARWTKLTTNIMTINEGK